MTSVDDVVNDRTARFLAAMDRFEAELKSQYTARQFTRKDLEAGTKFATADGFAFFLATPWYYNRGKVEVSVSPPRAADGSYRDLRSWGVLPYNDSPPSAGFALDRLLDSKGRGAQAVVAEVVRKVIKPYGVMYEKLLERKKAEDDGGANGVRVATDIANLLGEQIGIARAQYGPDIYRAYEFSVYSGGKKKMLPGIEYTTVTLNGDGRRGSIKLEGLSEEQLKKVLTYLKGGGAVVEKS